MQKRFIVSASPAPAAGAPLTVAPVQVSATPIRPQVIPQAAPTTSTAVETATAAAKRLNSFLPKAKTAWEF